MNEAWLPLCSSIQDAQNILLISHIFPDGDTCGSALALRRALISLGKDVTCCCEHSVPEIYKMLDGASAIESPAAHAGRIFDLAISIDVSDPERMGAGCGELFVNARHTAQIDHHGTNPAYAAVNIIRSPLSATGVSDRRPARRARRPVRPANRRVSLRRRRNRYGQFQTGERRCGRFRRSRALRRLRV